MYHSERVSAQQENKLTKEQVGKLTKKFWNLYVVRQDIYAKYYRSGSPACIADQNEPGAKILTPSLLALHCQGKTTIGVYTTEPKFESCIWMDIDIDAHDDRANPEANLKYALAKYDQLRGLRFTPLLTDSNGKGGYHLDVFFSEPISAGLVRAFGYWLTRDHAEYGIESVEVFPKQDKLSNKRCGNQVRLPGKHHKREHWSKVWNGSTWLEFHDAVEFIIGLERAPKALIPSEARAFKRPAPPKKEHEPDEWDSYDTVSWWTNYDGDLGTLDILKLFEDAGLTVERTKPSEDGPIEVRCPWHEEHTTGDSGTAIWAATDDRFPGFNCYHSHCEDRGIEQVLAYFGKERVDAACQKLFIRPEERAERAERQRAEQVADVVQPCDTSKLPEDLFAECKADPWYSYLWKGNHAEYVTNQERQERIAAIAEVRKFIPSTGLISSFVRAALPTTDGSVLFHVGGAVSLAGHLLNRRGWVKFGPASLYPNLWTACIGKSSSARKSSSINYAKRVLSQISEYRETLIADSFTMEGVITEIGHIIEPGGSLPVESCEDMYQNDPACYLKGIGLFHVNEIGGFLDMLAKTYNVGGKAILTEWYDCPYYWKKVTRTQGMYYLHRPCISILGASTLAWLSKSCTEADLAGGFLPRWLFIVGGEKNYHLSFPDAPLPDDERELFRLAKELIARPPAEMYLSKSAMDRYDEWQRTLLRRIDRRLDSWANRMIGHALKLAMIYQASIDPHGREIAADNLNLATLLIDRIADDLAGLLDTELAFGEEDEGLKRVLKHVKEAKETGIDHSALSRKVSPMSSWHLSRYIKTLGEQERIRTEKRVGGNHREANWYYILR